MLFALIIWLFTFFLQGLFSLAVLCFIGYWFFLKDLPAIRPNVEPQFEKFVLSQTLIDMIDSTSEQTGAEPSDQSEEDSSRGDDLIGNNQTIIALNMIFQFLFQELKDTKAVRRYIIRKLSFEFNELLTTKAAGKFLTKISARDFSLGTSFPVIHDLKLDCYKMDKEKKVLQELSAIVNLEYTNGFSLSVDADLILGRSAYVHIKILSIKGNARIQFARTPFTHWNFAFIEEPQIEFDATSHFDGRQIPQLTTLILNQLRRSIRRKHQLPNYKCRFKPFFDQIYTQNLYKQDLDDILRKRSNSELLDDSHNSFDLSSNKKVDQNNLQTQANKTKLARPLSFKNSDKHEKISTSYQYRKLCHKLGFDLTSKGRLRINLDLCEKLPEALYSLNFPVLSQQPLQANQSTATVPSSQNNDPSDTSIYITTSLDKVSMKTLMNRQICKEHWPLIEYEIVKTSNELGLVFMDLVLINRNEVVVKKLLADTLASSTQLKMFDIIHSVNQQRINSLKQLQKILNKVVINSSIKFTIQRPYVMLENIVMTSSSSALLSGTSSINKQDALDAKQAKVVFKQKPSESENAQDITVPIPIPSPTTNNTISSSLFPNTRLKIENLFSDKSKLKIFTSNGSLNASASSSPTNQSNSLEGSNQIKPTNLSISPSKSQTNSTSVLSNFSPQIQTSLHVNQPQVYAKASASCLVDFFCSASERSIGEELDLDLISLLTNDTSLSDEAERMRRMNSYHRTSKLIKLNKENVLSFDNIPLKVDEYYDFDLNENTKYLNIFLWTNQYLNKMTKMKNLLIGYISIPLYEINVDCWNTSKGESQSNIHFSPIDELKASAISKLTHSHVVSDHPGFDACLSVGSLILNFKHELPKADNEISRLLSDESNKKDKNKEIRDSYETKETENSNDDDLLENLDEPKKERNLSKRIINELIEQENLKIEFKLQLSNPIASREDQIDDGSLHKFSILNFNEMVICEFCNKKIWLKKAYKCVYCNYIIHIKCYDKTIGKTICERFYAKSENKKYDESTQKITIENDDPFVVVTPPVSTEQSYQVETQQATDQNPIGPRSMVSNFFSGIRQRRWTSASENQIPNDSLKTNSFLNTLDLNFRNSISKNSQQNIVSHDKSNNNSNIDYLNDLDDHSSVSDEYEFKELDPNDDKLYGTELFHDLPVQERKVKFEEQILKYQSNIDMMTKIKSELDKELKLCLSSSNDNSNNITSTERRQNNEAHLKSQIKHLEEQMKGVVFLLMQCQIGLETCVDQPQIKVYLSDERDKISSKEPLMENISNNYDELNTISEPKVDDGYT